METLLQDLRYAARHLIKGRLTTVVTLLTLAFGIGANSSVYTLLNAALFRPLAAPDADRLVWVTQEQGGRFRSMSYPDYRDLRDGSKTLSGIMAYTNLSLSLGGDAAQRVSGLMVSDNWLGVLRLNPLVGRSFLPEDDAGPGSPATVMISEPLWRRQYGSDPAIIGRVLTINGQGFRVIGVGPTGFRGVGLQDPADLFVTFGTSRLSRPGDGDQFLTDRRSRWLRVIGRLAPTASVSAANAEIAALMSRLQEREPQENRTTGAAVAIEGGLDPSNRQQVLPVFSLLMVVPILVLVIACANVATLMLARGSARQRELGVRRAMGASRGRLIRQLLTESLLLSLLAGAAGALLSLWLTALVVTIGDLPPEIATVLVPDGRVFLFTGVVAVLTTFGFGLVPAITATRREIVPALKSEAGGRGRSRLGNAFVVAQVAMSLVLLIAAGLFLRSLQKAVRVDPGFSTRNAAVASYDLGLQGYSAERQATFNQQVVAAVGAIPGVEAVGLTNNLPLTGRSFGTEVLPEGVQEGPQMQDAEFATASAEYFSTLGVDLLQGRAFNAEDTPTSAPVVVVNEALAQRLWPGQPAIGKRLHMLGTGEPLREVVGVVRNGRYGDLTEAQHAFLYMPHGQTTDFGSEVTVVARTRGDAGPSTSAITKAIHSLDPNLPLYRVGTLQDALQRAVGKQRAASAMLGVFGLLALLLAALGLYGVTAHGVAARTREIGIRMSLGARSANVLGLFVREGVVLSLVGVVIGLLLSAAVSKLLSGFLFGLTATDGVTFASGAVVLVLVAAVASYLPARRATTVDPMAALRSE